MLQNGIYGLHYEADGADAKASGLAVLRDGEILGSDPWGGVFAGTCRFDRAARLNRVNVRFDVPPDGALITGFSAGAAGAVLDIVGAFEGAPPRASTVLEVMGAKVRVEVTYLG